MKKFLLGIILLFGLYFNTYAIDFISYTIPTLNTQGESFTGIIQFSSNVQTVNFVRFIDNNGTFLGNITNEVSAPEFNSVKISGIAPNVSNVYIEISVTSIDSSTIVLDQNSTPLGGFPLDLGGGGGGGGGNQLIISINGLTDESVSSTDSIMGGNVGIIISTLLALLILTIIIIYVRGLFKKG